MERPEGPGTPNSRGPDPSSKELLASTYVCPSFSPQAFLVLSGRCFAKVEAPPESPLFWEGGEEAFGVSSEQPILRQMHPRAACRGLLGPPRSFFFEVEEGNTLAVVRVPLPPLETAGVVARVPVPSWQWGERQSLGMGLRGGRPAFTSSPLEATGKGRGPSSPHPR